MKSGRSMNRRQLEDVTKSGLKLWYYPKVSLEVATPSNMPEHLDVKFDDWKQIYGMDILPEIKKNGQLDPNFVRWNGRAWVIEPGQSRWLALNELGIHHQKIIVLADEPPFDYENWEIKNKKDAEKVFLHSKWNDHHGLGYIRRRKYLVDDRPKIDFTEMKEHPRASYIALEKTENGVKLIFCNHQQLELKEYESNLEEV